MAITVASFSDSTQPLYRAGLADLLATVDVFSFSLDFRNSSFYDAYWSGAPPLLIGYWWLSGDGEFARVLVVFVIAPTWAVRLTGNWAGFVVMVVLFLGVSILLIDAQLLANKPAYANCRRRVWSLVPGAGSLFTSNNSIEGVPGISGYEGYHRACAMVPHWSFMADKTTVPARLRIR